MLKFQSTHIIFQYLIPISYKINVLFNLLKFMCVEREKIYKNFGRKFRLKGIISNRDD